VHVGVLSSSNAGHAARRDERRRHAPDGGEVLLISEESVLPPYLVYILPEEFSGRWIQIEGAVEVVEPPEALECWSTTTGASRVSTRMGGARGAMRREGRIALRTEPTRAGPDRSGWLRDNCTPRSYPSPANVERTD
jgi:hypothetical protein